MNKTTKKVLGLIGIGLIGLTAGVGAGFVLDQPKDIVTTLEVTKEVPVPFEVIKEVTVEVPVEKIVNNTVEVEVITEVEDNDFLKLACDRLTYDDIQECKEEVNAEDKALKLAIELIEDAFADELEDAGIVKDEKDVDIVKVYSDFEDIEVIKSDFDDEEYKFKIDVKVDDDDNKKKVTFTVEVEDGEAIIKNVVKV